MVNATVAGFAGNTGCGKSLIGQESMPQGLKAHDDCIVFEPGINPRPTLKPSFPQPV
jgi:hypothetical protein